MVVRENVAGRIFFAGGKCEGMRLAGNVLGTMNIQLLFLTCCAA
jgi:hypothetical protein